jgi:hypothetical protein
MTNEIIDRGARAIGLLMPLQNQTEIGGLMTIGQADTELMALSQEACELAVRRVLEAIREPTEAMQIAGSNEPIGHASRYDANEYRTDHCITPGLVWRAMIDAALTM